MTSFLFIMKFVHYSGDSSTALGMTFCGVGVTFLDSARNDMVIFGLMRQPPTVVLSSIFWNDIVFLGQKKSTEYFFTAKDLVSREHYSKLARVEVKSALQPYRVRFAERSVGGKLD